MNTRIFSMDVLRFLAIFLVSSFHIARFIGFDYLDINIFKLGWMGCGIFFVISGYFANASFEKYKNGIICLKKRFLHIIAPYFIAMFFG